MLQHAFSRSCDCRCFAEDKTESGLLLKIFNNYKLNEKANPFLLFVDCITATDGEQHLTVPEGAENADVQQVEPQQNLKKGRFFNAKNI